MNRIKEYLNHHFEHWQLIAIMLVLYDAIVVNIAYLFALLFRYDLMFTSVPRNYVEAFRSFAPYYTGLSLITFALLKLYRSLWRYASLYELIRIIIACFITLIYQLIGIFYIGRMPIIYYAGGFTIQLILLVFARFCYRFILLLRSRIRDSEVRDRVMLIGAGSAGQLLIRDNVRNPRSKDKIVCIIDDNPNKKGRFVDNIPIVGDRYDILSNVEKYKIDTIYLAIPSAENVEKRDILNICKETDCKIKTLPGIYSLGDDITSRELRDVSVDDLLGRKPINADLNEVYEFINGKIILVTGAGGSIGSELCRQIAAHNPKQLILFDKIGRASCRERV